MPSYGRVDPDYFQHLATCPPDRDGPVLMVNFMKYRDRADYGGGDDRGRSGREADDAYAPRDVLDAIGAAIVFFGDVEPGGDWDRVGIVRYPTRRSFVEMQARPDFQALHVHKAAGMDHTIVCGTIPEAPPAADVASGGRVVFELAAPGVELALRGAGRLRVEGTILGDGRRFAALGVAWVGDGVVAPPSGPERVVAVVRPTMDSLAALVGAPGA